MPTPQDIQYMHYALRLAARGLGLTAPNPSVGAVIVKDGRIVGTAVTARGGRPHAETQAIAEAGADAKGATLYVTLEPCSHHGKTPPCAQAIIAAGIAHVVCATGDSNPQVAGQGIAMLRAAGIEVVVDVLKDEARALNEGFFSVQERGRPFVTVKIATSLDGRTSSLQGEGRWITGETARDRGHLLRATHDAIITGIGTVLADDPELTCRLPGRRQDSPQRIVLDSALRISPQAKILPAWIFTSDKADKAKIAAREKAGSRVFLLSPPPSRGRESQGRLPLPEIVSALAKEGITRLLVEAGKTLTEAFMNDALADRVCWFRAPLVTGDKASIVTPPRLTLMETVPLAQDRLEIYEK